MVSFFLSIDLTLAGLVLCKIEEKINNTSTPPSGTNVKYPCPPCNAMAHPNSKKAMQKRKVKPWYPLVALIRSSRVI